MKNEIKAGKSQSTKKGTKVTVVNSSAIPQFIRSCPTDILKSNKLQTNKIKRNNDKSQKVSLRHT